MSFRLRILACLFIKFIVFVEYSQNYTETIVIMEVVRSENNITDASQAELIPI